ncbi:MAG: hypothetical protein Q7S86_02320 [bacterium]|nr:hypothetical protein [bacterium]
MVKILRFFDKLEDRVRGRLSRTPIIYAFVGGVAVVIFWRGIWHLADELQGFGGWWGVIFSPDISLIFSVLVLLGTGLFVSFFIGDRIIMSGLRHEKKIEEKTEAEVREEETMLTVVHQKLDNLEREISEIKSFIVK